MRQAGREAFTATQDIYSEHPLATLRLHALCAAHRHPSLGGDLLLPLVTGFGRNRGLSPIIVGLRISTYRSLKIILVRYASAERRR